MGRLPEGDATSPKTHGGRGSCHESRIMPGRTRMEYPVLRLHPKGLSAAEVTIREVDPLGHDALALLREAAIEARALYPESRQPGAPLPTNSPTPARGTYLIAYSDGKPMACGALRPLDDNAVEIRRMFVTRAARRKGFARAILRALEEAACRFGYTWMRLETGNRQLPAMGLYEAYGFAPIEPFGEYVGDPTSVCYEKAVAPSLLPTSDSRS